MSIWTIAVTGHFSLHTLKYRTRTSHERLYANPNDGFPNRVSDMEVVISL